MAYFGKKIIKSFSASKSVWMGLTCTALLMTGCVSGTKAETAEMSTSEAALEAPSKAALESTVAPIATIKPGASLDFTSEIDGLLSVGAYTDVEITIVSAYTSGLLQLTATGTDGLDILSSSASLNHDLALGRAVWRVAVRPTDEGLHYLNIMAIVSGQTSEEPAARAFSIAIDPGAKSRPRDIANKPTISQGGADNLAIYEADETLGPAD